MRRETLRQGVRIAVAVLLSLAMHGAGRTASASQAPDPGMPGKIILYFFWGDGCPHCGKEKLFLETMRQKYPQLEIRSYEVWRNQQNAAFFTQMTKAAGMKSAGVPVTFVHKNAFVGFTETTGREIEEKIGFCAQNACVDTIEILKVPLKPADQERTVNLPLIGKIDATKVSLPTFTLILAGMDSFNPCAFFVLFFLLSLLIHARSRKRMLLIGGTFVFFSGFIYFLFMAAWLSFFMLTGRLLFITTAAGVVALAVAVINIKDFFYFQKGVSLSIPEKAKPKLFERMRNLLKSTSLVSMLTGTVVLSIAANTYELLCTAGFPMVFTRILTLQNIPPTQYYVYLALYNVVYVVPLAVIVIGFTITLGSRKLTEWEGRKLKLVSGIMMFLLGIILLVDPSLLNNLLVAAGILVLALLIFGLTVVITRRFSPRSAAG